MSKNMRSGLLVVFGLLFCVSMVACSRFEKAPEDPKRRLTEYISRSFAVKAPDDRKTLVDFLTGEAKVRLSAWSEEQFRAAFMDSKRQFIRLAFREVKPINSQEVNITYELTYLDQSRGRDAKVTNKKLCRLVLEKNRWYIAEVHNIKELVEYRNEMALP